MPLCEVSDTPNSFDRFRASVNYGFSVPTSYLVGISGLADIQPNQGEVLAAWGAYGQDISQNYGGGIGIPLTAAIKSGNWSTASDILNRYVATEKQSAKTSGAGPGTNPTAPPPGSFAAQTKQFLDVLTPFVAQGAAAFQKNRKATKNIVVEQKQDYTMYALIGGGVLVAAILAISVGKSRKKD